MTLLELADAVERASGADRQLDYRIMCATVRPGRGYMWDPEDDHHRYTASLDAAMTLVPDDYDWAVFHTNGGLTFHAWCGTREDVFGDTPALALTAACLKARAAIENTHADEVRG